MIERSELIRYCNRLLEVEQFNDYCPNGLQIEGCSSIKRIVSGVTASQALIDATIELQADLLLVHHGFFWKGEKAELSGIKKNRIKSLLLNDINLLAYHLPLDAHKTLGNNAILANRLGLDTRQYFATNDIAILGDLEPGYGEQSGKAFKNHIAEQLAREPLHVEANRVIKRVALCTGAAQSYIEQAIDMGADAFISGEISENTWHIAKENNIHYYAAGHHASERYGVQALGDHLSERFDLKHEFVDIYNPV